MSGLAELDGTLSQARWEVVAIAGALALLALQLRRADVELGVARSEMVIARGRAERAEDARDEHKQTIDKLLEELHAQAGYGKPDKAHESEP